MSAERARRVDLWDARARGYDDLLRRHALLRDLADRLVSLVPEDAGDVLDVGAGTGLCAARLLARRPAPRVHLCEPASAMRSLARARLGDAPASLSALAAEEVDRDPAPVDAAVSSACLHLSDLPRALGAIRARLRPGGVLVFNLWWHAWAPTADDEDPGETQGGHGVGTWRTACARSLRERGHDPTLLRAATPRAAPLSERELASAARAAGLELRVLPPDEDRVPGAFFVDFAAMDPAFLGELPDREACLARARELAAEPVRVRSTRFVLTRSG